MNRTELEKLIFKEYKVKPDFPWYSAPTYAVFRHKENKKWFAVIMDIPKNRMGLENDEIISIVNFKCDPILVGSLILEEGFFKAYHMNKTNWITAALDGSADDEKIKFLLDYSFDVTKKKTKHK